MWTHDRKTSFFGAQGIKTHTDFHTNVGKKVFCDWHQSVNVYGFVWHKTVLNIMNVYNY
jgi:hypothetical protein